MTMHASGNVQRFPTTSWTLVARAGGELDEIQRAALDQLLSRYWPALKSHLVRKKRIDPNNADDLVQGFIAQKVLEKHLVGAAEWGRGRFRNLLATALDNYVANQIERHTAQKRAPDRAASLDAGDRPHQDTTTRRADDIFDVEWARGVLAQALRRMQAECMASDRADVWEVFQGRIAAPILEGADPMSYNEIVERFGYRSPAQASNVLITAKRTFGRVLRAVVAEYAADEQEIDTEIRDLQRILSNSAPR